MPARIILVHHNEIMRHGLRAILGSHPLFRVVGDAGDHARAWEMIVSANPRAAVLELDPAGEALDLTRRIHAVFPRTKVLLVAARVDPTPIHAALAAGASAFLVHDIRAADLLAAVQSALADKVYLCADATTALLRERAAEPAAALATHRGELSSREQQVLRLVATGRRNKEIACELQVSIKSVETYRGRLMKKLGCGTPAELARFAVRAGLVTA